MKKQNSNNLLLLIDNADKGDFFLYQELRKEYENIRLIDIPNHSMKDRTVKWRILNMYLKYIVQAIKAINLSNPGDTIICWNFTTGIGVGILNRFLFRKRKILAMNMIAHPSRKIVSQIRYVIFHFAMNQPHFYLTVNSSIYIQANAQRFHISEKNFFTLNDPVRDEFNISADVRNDHYVFSGGEAQRDWPLFFEAARQLPDIPFVGVARKKFFDPALVIPPNVMMKFDLDYESFFQWMGASSIVVLPLKSTFPCGLLVIRDAGLMKKPMIVTRTPSTENYILQEKTGILVDINNVEEMKNQIRTLFGDENKQMQLGSNLHDYISTAFSVQRYFENFKSIVNSIQEQ